MNIVRQAEIAWNKHAIDNADKIKLLISMCPASEQDIIAHVIRQGWMLQWIRENSPQ